MKAKAFLEKVKAAVGIQDEAFTKALENSALAELELGDAIEKEFDNRLLTRERAENDKDIVKKIGDKARKDVFDRVDSIVKQYYPLLESEDVQEIEGTFLTFEKLEKAQVALRKAVDKAKSSGASQDVAKLQAKIQEIETQKNAELKKKDQEWADKVMAKEEELKNSNLDFVLKSKIFAHTFAKEYATDKEQIAELKIAKLKRENILSMEADGSIKVQYKDNDGVLHEKFNGNEKVSLDSLIKAEVEPFTKKHSASDDSQEGTRKKSFKETDGSDVNKTLAELRGNARRTTVTQRKI